jgi:hypothetical protein
MTIKKKNTKKEVKKTYIERLKEKNVIYEEYYNNDDDSAPYALKTMFYVQAEFSLPQFYSLTEEEQKEMFCAKLDLLGDVLAANIKQVKEI